MISCDLINKTDNSSGFISGFFGLPGLATWAARPDPTRSKPGLAQSARAQLRGLLEMRRITTGGRSSPTFGAEGLNGLEHWLQDRLLHAR